MTATSDVPSRPSLVLSALGAGAGVIGLDLFSAIGALDEVAGSLAIPPQEASWMISLYTLCNAGCAS
jgi:predicted MFS family arabinose efflux permease